MNQHLPYEGFDKYKFFKTLDYTADGPRCPYDPSVNPAQAGFHKAADEGKRFLSMIGGSGVGKSIAAAREAEIDCLCPNNMIWIVGSKYELSEKEFRYIWEDLVVGHHIETTHKTYDIRNGNMKIEFPWGTRVECKSEQVEDTLLGEGINCLVLAEGAKLHQATYERYLERAVARRKGRVICNTTPAGLNWIYDKFYLPGQNGSPLHWSGLYDVLSNPFYSRDEYERLKATLPAEVFQEQIEGRFVRFSGLIFNSFDRRVHCGKKAWDREWPLWVSIDVNSGRGDEVLFMVITPENHRQFVGEIWMKCGLEELSEMIRAKSRQLGKFPNRVIYDGPEIDSTEDGTHIKRLMREANIRGKKARKLPKGAQFIDMAKLFKENKILIDQDECGHFCWELEHLEWHLAKSERMERMIPEEKNDDAVDAWRYIEAERVHFDIAPVEEVGTNFVDFGRHYGKRSVI